MSTTAFLANSGIRFLLWPVGNSTRAIPAFYENAFGFGEVYENPEWLILEGPPP